MKMKNSYKSLAKIALGLTLVAGARESYSADKDNAYLNGQPTKTITKDGPNYMKRGNQIFNIHKGEGRVDVYDSPIGTGLLVPSQYTGSPIILNMPAKGKTNSLEKAVQSEEVLPEQIKSKGEPIPGNYKDKGIIIPPIQLSPIDEAIADTEKISVTELNYGHGNGWGPADFISYALPSRWNHPRAQGGAWCETKLANWKNNWTRPTSSLVGKLFTAWAVKEVYDELTDDGDKGYVAPVEDNHRSGGSSGKKGGSNGGDDGPVDPVDEGLSGGDTGGDSVGE